MGELFSHEWNCTSTSIYTYCLDAGLVMRRQIWLLVNITCSFPHEVMYKSAYFWQHKTEHKMEVGSFVQYRNCGEFLMRKWFLFQNLLFAHLDSNLEIEILNGRLQFDALLVRGRLNCRHSCWLFWFGVSDPLFEQSFELFDCPQLVLLKFVLPNGLFRLGTRVAITLDWRIYILSFGRRSFWGKTGFYCAVKAWSKTW